MGSTKEQLLYKSEGVGDCVKWIKGRLKSEKQSLETNDWYYNPEGKLEREAVIRELVSVKIGLEKYAKKLKHEADEM